MNIKPDDQDIIDCKVYKVVALPPGAKSTQSKIIFRQKICSKTGVMKHKACLVAQGDQQLPGRDYACMPVIQ